MHLFKALWLNGNNSRWKLISVIEVFKADSNICTWSGSISAVILTGAAGEMSLKEKGVVLVFEQQMKGPYPLKC